MQRHGRGLAGDHADEEATDEGVAGTERVDDASPDDRLTPRPPSVVEQGGRGPAGGEGEPRAAGHGVGEEVEGTLLVQVAGREAGDREVGKDRLEVGRVAVDGEVEGEGCDGRQVGDLVLEHAAVTGVDEVEAAREGEVVRVKPEPRDGGIGADEDAVALDQHHVGVRVRALDDANAADVDSLGPEARQDDVSGAVGPDRPDVRRRGAPPGRGHGDVQGVAARIHQPEVAVAVDDVVAGAEEPHLNTRP